MTLIDTRPIFENLPKTDDLRKPPPGLDGVQRAIAAPFIEGLIIEEHVNFGEELSEGAKAKFAAFQARWKTANEDERRALAAELEAREDARMRKFCAENPGVIF